MRLIPRHPRSTASLIAVLVVGILLGAAILVLHRGSPPSATVPVCFVQSDFPVARVEYSPNDKLVISAGPHDECVAFRDARTGELVRQWQGDGAQFWLSDDAGLMLENSFASNGISSHCQLRETQHGRVIHRWRGIVKCIAQDFSCMLLLPNFDNDIRSNRARSAALIEPASGHLIGHVSLAANGRRPYLSRRGHWLCAPNTSEPSRLYHLPDLQSAMPIPAMSAMCVSPDEMFAEGFDFHGNLYRWRLPSGAPSITATGIESAAALYVSPKATIILGSSPGSSGFRDFAQIRSPDGRILITETPKWMDNSTDDLAFVAYCADGDRLGEFDLVDSTSGRPVAQIDSLVDSLGLVEGGRNATQQAIALAPDGHRLVTATLSGLLRFYDLRLHPSRPIGIARQDPGRPIMAFGSGDQGVIADAAAMPGGGVLAVGGSGDVVAASSHLGLWTHNMRSGAESMASVPARIDSAEQSIGRPRWLDARPNSISTVADNQNSFLRWNIKTGDATQATIVGTPMTFGGIPYHICQMWPSIDGKVTIVLWLATGNSSAPAVGLMELRETPSGKLLRRLDSASDDWRSWAQPHGAWRYAISPNGSIVAASTDNGRILLWRASTGHRIGLMTCDHSGPPRIAAEESHAARLAFSPDGRMLAVAQYDGSLSLYSMQTRLPIAKIGQTVDLDSYHSRPITWLAFDADGRTLYGHAMNDPHILTWAVPTVALNMSD